jgi:transposase
VPSVRQEARAIERLSIIDMAKQELVTDAARRFACSRTTVYALLARHERGGMMALANQPRGPQAHMQRRIPAQREVSHNRQKPVCCPAARLRSLSSWPLPAP